MSLMKTLAKVAIGVAVAKGASAMMKQRGGSSVGGGAAAAGGGLGGLLGGMAGGTGQAGAGGGLQDMLGSLMGGAQGGGGQAAGLQDMLGGLMGGAQGGAGAGGGMGGLGGLLESLGGAGGGGGAQGGLQGMLGGLAGAAGAGGLLAGLSGAAQRPADNGASFGQVLNSAFDQTPEPEIEPTADQEAAAALMLRAMIQAAKSDGTLDDAEQEKLVGQLGGDVDAEEAAFVRAQMAAPVDVAGLVADVPRGMGPQVYAMSVLAIDLDSQAEAKYLHTLAQGLGLDAQAVNDIHAQLGVPSLYT